METPQVFESEYRFCQILWENEPINSTRLVKLCAEKLGWSKGTTYTVIRRLAQRQVQQAQIDQLVEKTFSGSLPQFIAAFTQGRRLSADQAAEIQQMIDRYKEE